jgi:hypothetical protein
LFVPALGDTSCIFTFLGIFATRIFAFFAILAFFGALAGILAFWGLF